MTVTSQVLGEGEKANPKRLFRSGRQRLLAGVCGGLAEYFDLDATVVRLLWIIGSLLGGAGVLLYVILWVLMPQESGFAGSSRTPRPGLALFGFALVLLAILLFVGWPAWCAAMIPLAVISMALPGLLLAAGVALLVGWLIVRSRNGAKKPPGNEQARLYRSRDRRILAGICGGLGDYFNIDPTLIRILWVILALASLGTAVILYVILIAVIPNEFSS